MAAKVTPFTLVILTLAIFTDKGSALEPWVRYKGPRANSLIGYWPFDSTYVFAEHIYNRNLTWLNNPAAPKVDPNELGPFRDKGGCLIGSSRDNSYYYANYSELPVKFDRSFTISFFYWPSGQSITNSSILKFDQNEISRSGSFIFFRQDPGNWVQLGQVEANAWNFVSLTYQSGSSTLNFGRNQITILPIKASNQSVSSILLGSLAFGDKITCLLVYRHPLNESELDLLTCVCEDKGRCQNDSAGSLLKTLAPRPNTLAAIWPFDEESLAYEAEGSSTLIFLNEAAAPVLEPSGTFEIKPGAFWKVDALVNKTCHIFPDQPPDSFVRDFFFQKVKLAVPFDIEDGFTISVMYKPERDSFFVRTDFASLVFSDQTRMDLFGYETDFYVQIVSGDKIFQFARNRNWIRVGTWNLMTFVYNRLVNTVDSYVSCETFPTLKFSPGNASPVRLNSSISEVLIGTFQPRDRLFCFNVHRRRLSPDEIEHLPCYCASQGNHCGLSGFVALDPSTNDQVAGFWPLDDRYWLYDITSPKGPVKNLPNGEVKPCRNFAPSPFSERKSLICRKEDAKQDESRTWLASYDGINAHPIGDRDSLGVTLAFYFHAWNHLDTSILLLRWGDFFFEANISSVTPFHNETRISNGFKLKQIEIEPNWYFVATVLYPVPHPTFLKSVMRFYDEIGTPLSQYEVSIEALRKMTFHDLHIGPNYKESFTLTCVMIFRTVLKEGDFQRLRCACSSSGSRRSCSKLFKETDATSTNFEEYGETLTTEHVIEQDIDRELADRSVKLGAFAWLLLSATVLTGLV